MPTRNILPDPRLSTPDPDDEGSKIDPASGLTEAHLGSRQQAQPQKETGRSEIVLEEQEFIPRQQARPQRTASEIISPEEEVFIPRQQAQPQNDTSSMIEIPEQAFRPRIPHKAPPAEPTPEKQIDNVLASLLALVLVDDPAIPGRMDAIQATTRQLAELWQAYKAGKLHPRE